MTHSEITALTGLRVDHGASPSKNKEVWRIRDGLLDEYCEASAQDGGLSERRRAAYHSLTLRGEWLPKLEFATRSGALYQREFATEEAAWKAIEALL